jgi:hypothetical protein
MVYVLLVTKDLSSRPIYWHAHLGTHPFTSRPRSSQARLHRRSVSSDLPRISLQLRKPGYAQCKTWDTKYPTVRVPLENDPHICIYMALRVSLMVQSRLQTRMEIEDVHCY